MSPFFTITLLLLVATKLREFSESPKLARHPVSIYNSCYKGWFVMKEVLRGIERKEEGEEGRGRA